MHHDYKWMEKKLKGKLTTENKKYPPRLLYMILCMCTILYRNEIFNRFRMNMMTTIEDFH